MKTLLGQRIREQRRKKGWTMDKLAEKADQSVNYVGDLERGVKTPSLDTFIRIVEALDVPADVLIRDSAAPASYVADDELNRKLSRLTPGQKKAATDILNACCYRRFIITHDCPSGWSAHTSCRLEGLFSLKKILN